MQKKPNSHGIKKLFEALLCNGKSETLQMQTWFLITGPKQQILISNQSIVINWKPQLLSNVTISWDIILIFKKWNWPFLNLTCIFIGTQQHILISNHSLEVNKSYWPETSNLMKYYFKGHNSGTTKVAIFKLCPVVIGPQ